MIEQNDGSGADRRRSVLSRDTTIGRIVIVIIITIAITIIIIIIITGVGILFSE